LAPGEVKRLEMKGVPLSNQGGLISLLDDQGIKVDGVSYTKPQTSKEGEVIIFR
jgi:AICAR transformylase/IMP cyclohydrolase PurH